MNLPNRVLAVVPMVIVAAYMTVGHMVHFRTEIIRLVATVSAFMITGALYTLNRRGAASAVDKAFAVYTCLAALGFWLSPQTLGRLAGEFPAAMLYAVLFLAAAVPPIAGREPFTAHFARKVTPEAVWQTDAFRTINLNLNRIWTAIFGACVLSSLMPGLMPWLRSPASTIVFEAVLPLAFICGIGLTLSRYYPDHYMQKVGLPLLKRPNSPISEPGEATGCRVDRNPVESQRGPERMVQSAGSFNRPLQEDTSMENRKVVAVNGSPHTAFGNTGLMLEMLRDPLSRHGLDLEVVHLSELRIEYCIGCALCLEKGSCWIRDDYKTTAKKLSEAHAVILGSPVYIRSVTGQMKTFLDRSVARGHRPERGWKPGLAISVSAGYGETSVGEYLGNMLRLFGAYPVGILTAIAVSPGAFLGKEEVERRARDLARDLAAAVNEKRRRPATDRDYEFWSFMKWLVYENRDFMKADHSHWESTGLYESFEGYVGQDRASGTRDPDMRRAWIDSHVERQREQGRKSAEPAAKRGPQSAGSARELLEMMPLGLNPSAAAGMSAVYQFEITGDEEFIAHLSIVDGKALFCEGPSENASVTIMTLADVWLKIARGDLDGAQAFMSGKYKVKGDIGLLMKLKSLFPG
ncbi:MAG: NAD(P)H-dependent oxidoreductase [Pseudomonadota bacterium]